MGQRFKNRDQFLLIRYTFGNHEHMDAEAAGVGEISQVGGARVSRLAP